ncbi:MAG: LuxR family transcriptional regulator, regulator of acetate metabolism [Nocardioidaceae bacterium]|nr:LuxR family transcriptional regulator, regulator of acetate metabolism [Nocardioidaceae bacterium]
MRGLRPRDSDALRASLKGLLGRLDGAVVFGGVVGDDTVVVSETFRTRTPRLKGLTVRSQAGLGGRVMAEGRPGLVTDYRTARNITHDYDREVLGEGIRSLLAVPVNVLGDVRAVIYVGSRERWRETGRVTADVVKQAHALGCEIRVRDEVERRMAHLELTTSRPADTAVTRELWAELRTIALASSDPQVTERLMSLTQRLAPIGPQQPALSRREVDVLSFVALGCGNREIAERLGVGIESVRGYLRSSMRKLDSHTRLEALVAARRRGALP